MQKHYFELDKIESITFTAESATSYRWFPEIPAKEKSFMGIKYGMTEAIPAGWNDCIDEDGNEYRPWNRKQSSYFDDYSFYKVTPFRIYNKAHVIIGLGYKRSFGLHFDSDAEAQAWVDKLVSKMEKEVVVIINH